MPESSLEDKMNRLAVHLDDSSDEEDVQAKITEYDVKKAWSKFKDSKERTKIPQLVSEDELKSSFEMHAEGISKLYHPDVNSIYYKKKAKELALRANEKDNLKVAIESAVKKALIDLSVFKLIATADEVKAIHKEILEHKTLILQLLENIVVPRAIGIRAHLIKAFKGIGKAIYDSSPQLQECSDRKVAKVKDLTFNLSSLESHVVDKAVELLDEVDLLTAGCKVPNKKARDKNWDFTSEYPELIAQAWNVVQKKGTEGHYAKTDLSRNKYNINLLVVAYIKDLQNKDIDKNALDNEVWKLVRNNRNNWNLVPYFALSQARVIDLLNMSLHSALMSCLKLIPLKRPRYSEVHSFESANENEFLANLRLSIRSQRRHIRSSEVGEEETVARGWRFGTGEKQAVETQSVSTKGRRTDLVSNAGNYKEVYVDICTLMTGKEVEDKVIAKWILQVLNGKEIDTLVRGDRDGEEEQALSFTDNEKKILVNLTYLILGCETVRNPASYVATHKALQLIEGDKLDWKKALDSNKVGHYSGGLLPMTPGKNLHKESADIVKSARWVHKVYEKHMPYPYKYEGEESSKSATLLIKGEAKLQQTWQEKIAAQVDDKKKAKVKV